MAASQSASGGGDSYPHVFTPLSLGKVEVHNRIFVPAHTTNYGLDHLPTARHLAYHEARARGGAGLIIFESIRVHRTSLGKPQGIAGYDRRTIHPFREIANAVHRHGAALFGQLIHLGRQTDGDALRVPAWGPSPIPWDTTAPVPHAMDREDIAALISGFVASAENILEAGLDGFEVHVGHGHLLQQFLSPASNERTDDYGGSEANRMRLTIEVLAALRAAVGPDTCMGIRVSGDEFLPDGLTLADMSRIVPRLLDAVRIDFVNVSHSAYHGSYSLSTQIADMAFPVEPFRHIARTMKQSVLQSGHNTPVMAVCKFRSITDAEDMLAAGSADMVGMARAHIADPNIVAKAAAGHASKTRPCIGCNQGCAGFLEKGLPITCMVNPGAGKETEWTPEPSDSPTSVRKRVLVVGGGPGGLEAAWVAAARGHEVTLWERDAAVGGALRALHHMPLRHDFLALLDHQVRSCERFGVTIETGVAADAERVADHHADVVVVALGADLAPVEFPAGGSGITLVAALESPGDLGATVAFYDLTGSWGAISVAEHLARIGKHVTIFTPGPVAGWRVTQYSRTAIAKRLRELGVKIATAHHVIGWDDEVLQVTPLDSGVTEVRHGFDSVVAAGHGVARTRLAGELAEAGIQVVSVGDCLAPRTALEAVFEGHEVAREI